MAKDTYRLLVVAHPDDEVLFFGGIVLSLRTLPWRMICVTDGNADGRGAERREELLKSAKMLGIKKLEHWDFPDIFEKRLDVNALGERLQNIPAPKEVFTHGPLGEYGHPHHQDISLAVHRLFSRRARIWSPAWNCLAQKTVKLSPALYKRKTKILSEVYGKEIERFFHIIPNASVESFRCFTLKEVESMAGFLRREQPLDTRSLGPYSWMAPELGGLRDRLEKRLF